MLRVLRWLGLLVGGILALAVLLVLGAFLYVRTVSGNAFLLERVLPLAQPDHGRITVEGISTNLLGRLELTGVRIEDAAGNVLLEVPRIEARYRLGGLPGRRLIVSGLEAEGVVLDLVAPDGTCLGYFSGLWDPSGKPSSPWSGIGIDLSVDDIALDMARLELCAGETVVAGRAELAGSMSILGPVVAWNVGGLGADVQTPVAGKLNVATEGSWDGDDLGFKGVALTFDSAVEGSGRSEASLTGGITDLEGAQVLAVTIEHLAVDPAAFGVDDIEGGSVAGTIAGTLAAPTVDLAVVTAGGDAQVVGGIVLADRPTWKVAVTTASLAVDKVVAGLEPTEVHGRINVEGAGLTWPADLEAHVVFDGGSTGAYGQGPLEASVIADLREGVVTVVNVSASGPGVSLDASARVDVVAEAFDVGVVRSRVDLRQLSRVGLKGVTGSANFRGKVAGDWADGVDLGVDGTFRVTDARYGEDALVETLTGTAQIGVAGGVARGNVVWTAEGVTVAGNHADGGGGSVRLDGDRIGLVASLVSGEIERLGIDGEVNLATQHVRLDRLHVAPPTGAAWDAADPVVLTWTDGGVRDAHARLVSGETSIVVDGSFESKRAFELQVDVAGFSLATIGDLVPERAGWEGTLSLRGALSGRLDAPVLSMTGSAAGITIPGAVAGLDVGFTADAADGVLRADLSPGSDGVARGRIEAAVPYRLSGGTPAIDAKAPIRVVAELFPGSVADTLAIFSVASPGVVRDASAAVVLTGSLAEPRLAVTGAAEVLVGESNEQVEVDLDVLSEGTSLTLRGVGWQRLARRIELSGSATFDLGRMLRGFVGDAPPMDFSNPASLLSDLSVDVVPLQLPIASLSAFVPIPADLHGSLLGGFHLGGSVDRPELAGGIMVIDGRLGDLALSPATASFVPEGEGFAVDVDVGFGGGGRLHVSGMVPVEASIAADLDAMLAREGLDLKIEGSSVPLEVLAAFVPSMTSAAGILHIGGDITGSLGSPLPRVDLSLTDGSFTLWSTNVRYEAVNLGAHLDAEALTVHELSVTTRSAARSGIRGLTIGSRSQITGRGRVAIEGWKPGEIDVDLALDQAWILDLPDMVARLTGDLGVSGTLGELAVRGRLSFDEGRVVLDESFFAGGADLVVAPDIHVLRGGLEAERSEEEAPFLEAVDLGLVVFLNRNVDLDVTMPTESYGGALTSGLSQVRLDVQLGDVDGVDVKSRDGALQLAGQVETLGGEVSVLGRDFQLTQGTLAFTGLDYANPLLDLVAEHDSSYGTITARITGTAESPAIDLTTDNPSYGSEDDAVAILLFGAPVAEMGGQQESSNMLGAALQSLTAGQVTEVGKMTSLDVFELGADGLTTGKRFGSNVLVTFTFNGSADGVDENPVEVALELDLPNRWYLEMSSGSAGITSAAAYRRWRF